MPHDKRALKLAAQALVRDARNEHFNLCLLDLERLEEAHTADRAEDATRTPGRGS